MIIPVRCVTCGNVLANKWNWYQKRVKELKGGAEGVEKRTYFDGTTIPETAEAAAMKELDLNRYCCRRILLTHVDLIPKF